MQKKNFGEVIRAVKVGGEERSLHSFFLWTQKKKNDDDHKTASTTTTTTTKKKKQIGRRRFGPDKL